MSGSAWGVWSALCTFAVWQVQRRKIVRSKPQSCYPSLATLAKRAFLCVNTTKKAIRELEALGMVRVVPRFAPTDEGPQKERMSNYYDLFPSANASKAAEEPMEREEFQAALHDFVEKLNRHDV